MNQETKVLLGIGLASLVILFGGIFLFGRNNFSPSSSISAADEKILSGNNRHKIATESAKVTIVEFGDYQCPACAEVEPMTRQMLKDYSGKINFVFRNFPLPQHKNAQGSAQAAEAAGEQGKFWEMNSLLYEKQKDWAESDQATQQFSLYAKQLGLDTGKFEQEVKNKKFESFVKQDQDDGLALGISSTPTFFINGQKIQVLSYPEFKSKIEEELKK